MSFLRVFLRSHRRALVVALVAVVAVIAIPSLVTAAQNIFIGSTRVADIRVGNTPVNRVYVGSSLVWERTIQYVTSSTCPTASTAVRDDRDGHYYSVRKLSDGRCWMLTNLAYGGSEAGQVFTTGAGQSTTTNVVASTSAWNMRNPPYNNQKQYATHASTITLNNGVRCVGDYRTSPGALDGSECGYLYNWCAALGNASGSCAATSGVVSGAGVGLCPAGWRLPSLAEYNTLYNWYGNALAFKAAFGGVPTGGLFGPGNGLINNGSSTYIFTSTAISSTTVGAVSYNNSVDGTITLTTAREKYQGMTVRCTAI